MRYIIESTGESGEFDTEIMGVGMDHAVTGAFLKEHASKESCRIELDESEHEYAVLAKLSDLEYWNFALRHAEEARYEAEEDRKDCATLDGNPHWDSAIEAADEKFRFQMVRLEDDTCGKAEWPEIGEETTVSLCDENGNPIEVTGKVVEIF